MLMDMRLPKFDVYQSKVAPNRFKSRTNSQCPDFFLMFDVLSDVWSDIVHRFYRTICSGLNKYIQACTIIM